MFAAARTERDRTSRSKGNERDMSLAAAGVGFQRTSRKQRTHGVRDLQIPISSRIRATFNSLCDKAARRPCHAA